MKKWTEEEIKILKDYYRDKSREYLCLLLPNRTWRAIKLKAFRFKLHLNYMKGSPKQRFWKYIDKKQNNLCWNWLGCYDKDGYGKIQINEKHIRAHRFSWELHFGKIPKDKPCVLHECNNPSCVNPNHLYLGTNEDNMRYMIECNRQANQQGENNGYSKLTESQVKQIRLLYNQKKLTQAQIAKIFNVCRGTISDIHRNKIWKHI